jgi:murein DD-endopeptidase MepM/ murein hydrolase activator NlpD
MTKAEPLVIEFPLRGEWLVMNPPAHPRYAFDVVAVESAELLRGGLRRYLGGGSRAQDSLSWAAPVSSPFDGVIVTASDGTPDRAALRPVADIVRMGLRGVVGSRAIEDMAGNHVIVEGGSGRFVLAHLRCGSVVVRRGDPVFAGDPVGAVGNSGNSVVPHLHMQALGRARRAPFASAPRFEVREFEQWVDGRWRSVRAAPLPRLARIRVR